jgi:hypothetical protein
MRASKLRWRAVHSGAKRCVLRMVKDTKDISISNPDRISTVFLCSGDRWLLKHAFHVRECLGIFISRVPVVSFKSHFSMLLTSEATALGKCNPCYITTHYFTDVQLNVILPSTPRSCNWFLLYIFRLNILCVSYLSLLCNMFCLPNSSRFCFCNNDFWQVQVIKLFLTNFNVCFSVHFVHQWTMM